MPLPREIIWSDVNYYFNSHPQTKKLQKVTNAEAVKQSVKLLVLSNFYERPFQPALGSNVPHLLFDNLDDITGDLIKEEIIRVINNYEPRAEVIDVVVDVDIDRNGFEVFIYFNVVNNTDPVVLDVFLQRVR